MLLLLMLITEMQPEITNTLTTLENCICLLFPTLEDFFIQDESGIQIQPESSVEKPGLTNSSITNQVQVENKIKEKQSLDQKECVSKLNDSDRQLKQNKNTVKTDSDVPSTSRPASSNDDDDDDDDDVEEDSLDSESEMSDPEGDTDFREYGMLNSKYSIEVNVITGICQ
jgi:hypothetical protein